MADRTIRVLSNLAAGATDTTDSPVIPNGRTLTISRFGGADVNLGDNKSSAYLLQFGTVGSFVDLGVIALTGNTIELAIGVSVLGNGAKFLRITRQNNSASLKRCPVWVRGYDNV